MIDTVTSTIQIGTGTVTTINSSSDLPAWLDYSVTYSDGTAIAAKQKLDAGDTETYKVRVEFKRNITNQQFESAVNKELHLTFGVEYVQKDNTAVAVPHDTVIYTANIYDGNDTTFNNGTNTSVVWIGQAIPSAWQYQTPALAMAALKTASGGTTDRPFFLKHTLTNNVVTESYVGFVISEAMVTQTRNEFITNCNNDQECIDGYQGMTAGTYYLKGKKTHEYVNNDWLCISQYDDGEGNCIDPDYNANKTTLLSAFGSSNCTDNSSCFDCGAAGLISRAYSDGYVYAEHDAWYCEVAAIGGSDCRG